MVKKQGETGKVAEGSKGILKACRDLQRIWRRFLEMRALPRCAAESSICSINYNSPPSLTPAILRHLFPFNVPTIREWNPGIHIQHYGWCNRIQPASPLPPLHFHPFTHTHWHKHRFTPPQTIPCGYLDVLSIRKWKWEREQIKALCHLRCLVHAVRFFLAAELIWRVNRFTDGEIVGPKRTETHSVCGLTCTLPCQGGVLPVLRSLHLAAIWIPRLHLFGWDCFHAALMEVWWNCITD